MSTSSTTTPNIVHGLVAFGSFSAALGWLLWSVRLGAWQFIQRNLIDGLCTDVWDGFFLSPSNLIAIGFLSYLPMHCYTNHAPATVQLMSGIMGILSYLFLIAVLLETLPVLLPVGVICGLFVTLGLSQLRLARRQNPHSQNQKQQKQKQQNLIKKKPSVSFSPLLVKQENYNNSIPAPAFTSNKQFFILHESSGSVHTNLSDLSTTSSLINPLILPDCVSPKDRSLLSEPNSSPISKRKRRES